MQRRHLRREYVSFRHIGNQPPTKAGIPSCRCRHIFSPTVSPCLAKGKHSSFPYPLTPTKPAFTVVLYFLSLFPILNIVSHLSPPPLSFVVWRLDIKYLLLVLFGSAMLARSSICTFFYSYDYVLGFTLFSYFGGDCLYRPQKPSLKAYKNIYEPYNICNYMQNY